MAEVTLIPASFKTSDGQEYPTKREAERAQELLDARKAYAAARETLGILLAEREKSAEGEPFRFDRYTNYYRVVSGWQGGPRIVEFGYLGHNWRWHESDGVVIENYDSLTDKRQTAAVKELFLDRENAERELVRRQAEWLDGQRAELDELTERLSHNWRGR